MAAVQFEMRPVIRDAHNEQTRSDYATLARIATAIAPIYSKHGFSLEFNTEPSERADICVVCECSHNQGHSKWYRLPGGLDTAGAQGKVNKTPMHGLGSSLSYLRRYLTCFIFNVALTDDDDGNAGGGNLRRGNRRENDPPPPPPRKLKLKDIIADLGARFAAAADRAAIEAIIAERETQTVLANITEEPGRTALAECIANGRARFPTAKDAQPPAFSAYVIDPYGDLASEEIHDPIRFAHAVVDQWRQAPTPELANSVIEHNSESIEDARAFGPAALVLLELKVVAEDPPHSAETERASTEFAADARDAYTEPHDPRDDIKLPSAATQERMKPAVYTPVVVEPPGARGSGKLFWPKWVQLFRLALETVPFANLDAWVDAQRETLTRAPLAQRLLAIRAIQTAYSPHDGPAWLTDLMRPDDPPPGGGGAKAPPARPLSGVSLTNDEQWVEERISDLLLLESRTAFNRIIEDNAVRNRMSRLRREQPALFEKADAAFDKAHRRLPAEDRP